MEKYQEGSIESFLQNPDYFESGLPYLDRIDVQIVPDASTQVSVLQSGRAMTGIVAAGSEAGLPSKSPNPVHSAYCNPSAWFHGIRADIPPFKEIRVRRAMAMGFEQTNVNKILGSPAPWSFGSVTASTGDASLPLEKLGDNAQWWKYKPAAGKQLLSAAGYPNGLETALTVSNYGVNSSLPKLFAADMAKIGIRVQEHPAYMGTTSLGNFEGLIGSQIPIWDANDRFVMLQAGSAKNISRIDDPTVKELTAKQRAAFDSQKRLDVIHELVRNIAGQVYHVTHPQAVQTVANKPVYMVTWLDK